MTKDNNEESNEESVAVYDELLELHTSFGHAVCYAYGI
jgi:hypothetical protein